MKRREPSTAGNLLERWESLSKAALAKFETEFGEACLVGGDNGLVMRLNAATRFYLALGDANDAVRVRPGRTELKKILASIWKRREIEGVEARLAATRIAYSKDIRLPSSGSNDSRMQAAMHFAACAEGYSGPDSIEMVRKSLYRFRQKVRGKTVFRLDRDTYMFEVLDAEAALFGTLPARQGRPRKAHSPNCS